MAPGEAPKRHSVRTVLHARQLAAGEGRSISAIAREVGVCRWTIAAVPAGLGRFARDPDRFGNSADVLLWPAGAARTGLLAMWLLEQAKPRD